ncbi:MAG: hypothetical protein GEU91_20815 [Rhizobiales bacterium]|nr:hypothetical protein [Hyphomicrobiales bacterium]
MRVLIVLACALACSACMQEAVRFHAGPGQQAIMRDGRPALISQKTSSLVMIRPALRQFPSGARPVFVVGIRNLTGAPLDFLLRNVAVTQTAGTAAVPMKVFSYEDLVAEERTRQVVAALLVGAAAGANTALASQAGYRRTTTTVHAPTGSYSYQTATYSPSAAVAGQRRALRQNARVLNAAIKDGHASLATLEREVIKDNTLMPGEWYGGTLHVQSPAHAEGATAPKRYSIAMMVGSERHDIDVLQDDVR